jgi:hypothetical protein
MASLGLRYCADASPPHRRTVLAHVLQQATGALAIAAAFDTNKPRSRLDDWPMSTSENDRDDKFFSD